MVHGDSMEQASVSETDVTIQVGTTSKLRSSSSSSSSSSSKDPRSSSSPPQTDTALTVAAKSQIRATKNMKNKAEQAAAAAAAATIAHDNADRRHRHEKPSKPSRRKSKHRKIRSRSKSREHKKSESLSEEREDVHSKDRTTSRRSKSKKRTRVLFDTNDHNISGTTSKKQEYRAFLSPEYFEALLDETILDDAIDTAVADLTGCSCDCGKLKESSLVRSSLRANNCYFAEPVSVVTRDEDGIVSNKRLSESELQDREDELRSKLDMMHMRADVLGHPEEESQYLSFLSTVLPQESTSFALTRRVAQKIRRLPSKDVTLYIKWGEDLPNNSCTAYEVNMSRWELGETTKLFRYFRICPLPHNMIATAADSNSKTDIHNKTTMICDTVASACLFPYTMAQADGSCAFLMPNPHMNDTQQKLQQQPFRPTRILLDYPQDTSCDESRGDGGSIVDNMEKLKLFLQFRLGIPKCQFVAPELRQLHEDSDLDFFHDDGDTNFFVDDDTQSEYGVTDLQPIAPLVGHNRGAGNGTQEEVREGVDPDTQAVMSNIHDHNSWEEMFDDFDNSSLQEIGTLLTDKKTSGVLKLMCCCD